MSNFTANEILHALLVNDVKVKVVEGKIKLSAPPALLTPPIIRLVRRHEKEIVELTTWIEGANEMTIEDVPCPKCGDPAKWYEWIWREGGAQIRMECGECGTYVKWASQTPDNIAKANRAGPKPSGPPPAEEKNDDQPHLFKE